MNQEFRLASCEGKESLPTWAVARDRARKMVRARKGEGVSFEPYRCHLCGGIHIGSYDPVARKGKWGRKKPELPDDIPGYPGHEDEVVY